MQRKQAVADLHAAPGNKGGSDAAAKSSQLLISQIVQLAAAGGSDAEAKSRQLLISQIVQLAAAGGSDAAAKSSQLPFPQFVRSAVSLCYGQVVQS